MGQRLSLLRQGRQGRQGKNAVIEVVTKLNCFPNS